VADSREHGDELARWAAERSEAVIERAEAEAVAVLRDALVRAALAGRQQRVAGVVDEPEPWGAPVEVGPTGEEAESELVPAEVVPEELLWAYCVLRAGDPIPSGLRGVHLDSDVRAEECGGLVALVSSVPRAEFSSEPLKRNLNDLAWLERVARAHEAVLDETLRVSTIVPLRMCTLYESDESVRQMLEREHHAFVDALTALDGRWEWAVKVLVDPDRLFEVVQSRSDPASERERQLAGQGEGGAYMLRKRRERELREAAHALATDIAAQVHARLQDWAIDATTRPPQNRQLSGHRGEMVLNAAYLVERDRVEELTQLVAELEEHHREVGISIELTGPWPPYNFVAPSDATTIG
jgi:hypothetical protein